MKNTNKDNKDNKNFEEAYKKQWLEFSIFCQKKLKKCEGEKNDKK